MRTELYKITTGSLLHDVGKVVHRTGDGHSHAESGYAFLKEQAGLDDGEILQQVRFHHAAGLKMPVWRRIRWRTSPILQTISLRQRIDESQMSRDMVSRVICRWTAFSTC